MPDRYDDAEIAEYHRMCKEAYADHYPAFEPYASMPIERLMELWDEAVKVDDIPRSMMLKQFVRDKMGPRLWLAHTMSEKLLEWFLTEYGREYAMTPEHHRAVGEAAGIFAMTVIDACIPNNPEAESPGESTDSP